MTIGLRQGVSFCEASDRLVFLDIRTDRYFALRPEAETAFRRLAEGTIRTAESPELRHLLHRGFLVEAAVSPPRPCIPPPAPHSSVLDGELPKVPVRALVCAASALARTRLQLRTRGLASVLRSVSASKARKRRTPSPDTPERVAASFEHSALLTRSHDQCLIRSAAAAIRLASLGAAAELVIGVRVRPFAAHCWIQMNDRLMNDRRDVVRAYTPILVL